MNSYQNIVTLRLQEKTSDKAIRTSDFPFTLMLIEDEQIEKDAQFYLSRSRLFSNAQKPVSLPYYTWVTTRCSLGRDHVYTIFNVSPMKYISGGKGSISSTAILAFYGYHRLIADYKGFYDALAQAIPFGVFLPLSALTLWLVKQVPGATVQQLEENKENLPTIFGN